MAILKLQNSVHEILTHDHPRKAEFQRLATQEYRRSSNSAVYAGIWEIVRIGKGREWFRSKLAGKMLVDLGAGGIDSQYLMRKFAKSANAALYAGVDKFDYDRGYSRTNGKVSAAENTAFTLFLSDILEFLSKLPTGTINFVINGLDQTTMENPYEYSRELAGEFGRICETGSLVFGLNSEVFHFLENFGFRRVPNSEFGSPITNIRVFEKT